MNCGILIIGSLLWDSETEGRKKWRDDRLDLSRAVAVCVPIDYGRISSSRANTFTMVLRSNGPQGVGILLPCRREVLTIDDLVSEASALWKAEAPKAKTGALGSAWGSVGILFQEAAQNAELAAAWAAHFKKMETKALAVVASDGSLNIAWPETDDGRGAEFDVILATATVPENQTPSPKTIAKAILGQTGGHESYFLNNVLHGIRTASDDEVFAEIERENPDWITADKYRDALAILRAGSDIA